MECFTLIFFKGLATPSQISHYTGLTTGAITQLLDRLEKAQLIKRQPNLKDRRGTIISLTEERIKDLTALFSSLRKNMEKLASSYSKKDQEIILDYFKRANVICEEERKKIQAL